MTVGEPNPGREVDRTIDHVKDASMNHSVSPVSDILDRHPFSVSLTCFQPCRGRRFAHSPTGIRLRLLSVSILPVAG